MSLRLTRVSRIAYGHQLYIFIVLQSYYLHCEGSVTRTHDFGHRFNILHRFTSQVSEGPIPV